MDGSRACSSASSISCRPTRNSTWAKWRMSPSRSARLADALAVDEGAVLAPEVADVERPPAQEELGVLLRDRVGGEGEGEPGEPPHPERQREAPRSAGAAVRPPRGSRGRSASCARAARGQGGRTSGPRVSSLRRCAFLARQLGRTGPAALAGLLVLLPGAPRRRGPDERLAAELRRAYEAPARPSERWRRRPVVRLPDGREVPREEAYRDDPAFVAAARRLLGSRAGDDAPLGAWLLGTLPEARRAEAEPALVEALAHRDARVSFEAAQALAAAGGPAALGPLRRGRPRGLRRRGEGRVGLGRGRDRAARRAPRPSAPPPPAALSATAPRSRPASGEACPGG